MRTAEELREEARRLHRELDAVDTRWYRARNSVVNCGATADHMRELWERLDMDRAYREARDAQLRAAVQERDLTPATVDEFRDAILGWDVQVRHAEAYVADLVATIMNAYAAEVAAREGATFGMGGAA